MQKTDNKQVTRIARRTVQQSTTLNRRYVKRPARQIDIANTVNVSRVAQTKTSSPQISRFGNILKQPTASVKDTSPIKPAKAHPTQTIANQRLKARRDAMRQQATRPTARELKDAAIKKALMSASRQTEQPKMAQRIQTTNTAPKQKKMKFGLKRVALAFTCATAAVFAIVYFVNLNMPDLQFRAAAAQFNATYPNYIPYNYSPTEIVSENGITTITFKHIQKDEAFSVTEEHSSWDSNALLNNYVKEKYGDDYTVVRERGLTIYISKSDAAWVNGGIVYKLETKKGSLSKKQISDIAVSF